jgi:hypothetical protein
MVKAWEPVEHQWIDTVNIKGTDVVVSTVLLATLDYSSGKLEASLDPENGTWETCLFWGDEDETWACESEVVERYTGQERAEIGHEIWTNYHDTSIEMTIKENRG